MATVHGIAYKNKRKTWLTVDILNEVGGHTEVASTQKLGMGQIVKRKFTSFSAERIAPLFATKRLGITSNPNPNTQRWSVVAPR